VIVRNVMARLVRGTLLDYLQCQIEYRRSKDDVYVVPDDEADVKMVSEVNKVLAADHYRPLL